MFSGLCFCLIWKVMRKCMIRMQQLVQHKFAVIFVFHPISRSKDPSIERKKELPRLLLFLVEAGSCCILILRKLTLDNILPGKLHALQLIF